MRLKYRFKSNVHRFGNVFHVHWWHLDFVITQQHFEFRFESKQVPFFSDYSWDGHLLYHAMDFELTCNRYFVIPFWQVGHIFVEFTLKRAVRKLLRFHIILIEVLFHQRTLELEIDDGNFQLEFSCATVEHNGTAFVYRFNVLEWCCWKERDVRAALFSGENLCGGVSGCEQHGAQHKKVFNHTSYVIRLMAQSMPKPKIETLTKGNTGAVKLF